MLALASLLTACTGIGDNLADADELADDREAADAMIQAALDVHAAHMNGRRPARLLMGGWEHIAEANTEWSHRLATALRGLEDEMFEDSPEAPWLLSPLFAEESELVFEVYNKEDPTDCCRTIAVRVLVRNGKLELRTTDGLGYVDYADPPQEVVAAALADEEKYMRDLDAEGVRKQ